MIARLTHTPIYINTLETPCQPQHPVVVSVDYYSAPSPYFYLFPLPRHDHCKTVQRLQLVQPNNTSFPFRARFSFEPIDKRFVPRTSRRTSYTLNSCTRLLNTIFHTECPKRPVENLEDRMMTKSFKKNYYHSYFSLRYSRNRGTCNLAKSIIKTNGRDKKKSFIALKNS